MELLKKLFGLGTRTIEDDLVDVMRVATEDPEVRQTLMMVLTLDDFQRQSTLGSMIEQLQLNGAPANLTRALRCLRDDEVARRALQMLQSS